MSFNGAADDITAGESSLPPFIEKDMLDGTLRDYLRQLVERRPFAIEIAADERYVMDQVAARWPHDAADLAQAERIWERVDSVVQSIPAVKTTPAVILHVLASASPLVPQSLPSPHGSSALATFDATSGACYSCVLPGLENLPPLDAMKVPAGLMVIAQPAAVLVNPHTDNRSLGMGVGNVYTQRVRDSHLPQHRIPEAAETVPSPLPQNNPA